MVSANMPVPFEQAAAVVRYVWGRRLRGQRRFALVLMLEPTLQCNLACSGCGKIRQGAEIMRRRLTPDQCLDAVEQCGVPVVSIAGGEPLLHPEIAKIVEGLTRRRKFVYLCTNALKLEESLDRFAPSKYLTFTVHLDGLQMEHDRIVGREGVFSTAVEAIRAALGRGFRVTTNTTLYTGVDLERTVQFFNEMAALGVESMTVSPGYAYEQVDQQEQFLHREQTENFFRDLFARAGKNWNFNQTPLYLMFLRGAWQLECTPWGNPTFGVLGWQRPCYLLEEGYCETFQELLDTTDWSQYGRASGNPKCRDCMVHCGYEPTAVIETLTTLRGMAATAKKMVFGR